MAADLCVEEKLWDAASADGGYIDLNLVMLNRVMLNSLDATSLASPSVSMVCLFFYRCCILLLFIELSFRMDNFSTRSTWNVSSFAILNLPSPLRQSLSGIGSYLSYTLMLSTMKDLYLSAELLNGERF